MIKDLENNFNADPLAVMLFTFCEINILGWDETTEC